MSVFTQGLSCYKKLACVMLMMMMTQVAHAKVSILGKTQTDARLYLDMWSAHATNKNRNHNNDLIGFSYHSFSIATLRNSYSKRSFAIGVQRDWLTYENYSLGYRAGLITGYKGHDVIGISQSKQYPVIPFAQLIFGMKWKMLGMEISVPNYSVVSLSLYVEI